MKTCRKCGETKPLDEFHRASNTPDGRQYRCKPCAISAARQRALDNPERHREIQRKYTRTEKYRETRARMRERNGDRIREQKRAAYYRKHDKTLDGLRERVADPEFRRKQRERYERWREQDPRGPFRLSLKTVYKLTLEQFDQMVLAQEGRCAVCGDPMQKVCVDHDHACCKVYRSCGSCVRALLCNHCNRGLGDFRDDPERLAAAITYLRAHSPG